MTIYTQTDDTGFSFQAALPIAEPPKDPPKGDIAVGPAPSGKALKFVHRGSYDAMDTTYEAITNYLDDKQLEAKDLFIEEYATDPVKTDPGQAGGQCVRAGEMTMISALCIALLFACALARLAGACGGKAGDGDRRSDGRGRARYRDDPHRRHQPGQDRARGERSQRQADDCRARRHQGKPASPTATSRPRGCRCSRNTIRTRAAPRGSPAFRPPIR